MFHSMLSSKNISDVVYNAGIILLIIILTAFILRWLWNRVLVPHISILKPLDSLVEAFLMSIAISVIRGY